MSFKALEVMVFLAESFLRKPNWYTLQIISVESRLDAGVHQGFPLFTETKRAKNMDR